MNFDISLSMDHFPPNFDIGNLKEGPLAQFQEFPDGVTGFIIALATVYNDLKDTDWICQQLLNNKPKNANQITAQHGQWNGMMCFVFRKYIAILFEFFELLNRNKSVFGQSSIVDTELIMSREYSLYWKNLKDVAFSKNSSSESEAKRIWLVCCEIRNSNAYHYYGISSFSDGFKKYLSSTGADARLYMSLGEDMEGSRFFFADAAGQNFYNSIFSKRQITEKQILNFVRLLNGGIMSFLKSFFQIIDGEFSINRDVRRKIQKRKK